MKIKESKLKESPLNYFDLLGKDETGLSKAFAYLVGKEPKALYRFLHRIGIKSKNTTPNFCMTAIEIEKCRNEGRTDIEIRQPGKYHVIIESKIGNNKVLKQRKQYIKAFDQNNNEEKALCFITGINDYNKEIIEHVQIHNLSWLEISDMLDNKEFAESQITQDFLGFVRKGYKMREQKEILIQDLGEQAEINRYKNYQVYRRGVVFGSPLYFAPHFTVKARQEEGEGIIYLSKVLGILSLKPNDIDNYTDDLKNFTTDEKLIKNWQEGVKIDQEEEGPFSYFFLGEPLKLEKPLRKDGGKKKGRGKDWIAAQIPKNRCVSFQEFVKRIIETK